MSESLRTTIPLHSPYDFEFSLQYFVRYGYDGLNRVDGGRWSRAKVLSNGRPVVYTVFSQGSVTGPTLKVEVQGESGGRGLGEDALREVVGEVRWILSLDLEMEPFFEFAQRDRWLRPLVEQHRTYRPIRFGSIFEGLVHAITAQQVNLPFAFRLRDRLIRRYGMAFEVDGAARHAFPTAEALLAAGPTEMREMQLSRQKAAYIHEVARAAFDGKFDPDALESRSDEEAIDRLTSVKGVGRWTAEWLFIRCMGRPDSFPADDAGVRRAVRKLCFDGRKDVTPKEIRSFAERWKPYRSLATQFVLLAQ